MNRIISIILTANTASLQSQLLTAQNAVKALEVALVAAGIGMAIGLNKAVQSAAEFQREMLNVATISQATRNDFQGVSDAVLEMSRQFPQSAITLAKGLYNIASSGFDGAEAMSVLGASAKAASAGMTTTDVAARGITAVLNAYGMSGFEAAKVSDILFQTVNKGVISFEELSNQLGDFVAMAAAFGKNARGDFIVPIEDAMAALATMTLSGLNAAEASTSLNRVLNSLIKPSEVLAAHFKDLGYETGVAAVEALGLKGTIDLLRETTDGNVTVLTRMFNEIRAARGALALMANEGKNYEEVARAITDTQERLNATQEAYNVQSKGLIFQQELAKNSFKALGIELGETFLPALTSAAEGIGDVFVGASSLPGPMKTASAVLLALASAVAIVGGSLLLLGPHLVAFRTAFPSLAAGIARAMPFMIGLGGVLTVGAIALAAYGRRQAEAKAQTDTFTQAILAEADGVKGSIDATIAQELAKRGLVDAANAANASLVDLNNAVKGDEEAMARVQRAFIETGQDAFKTVSSLLDLETAYKKATKEAKAKQEQMDAANPSAAALRAQLSQLVTVTDAEAQKLDEMAKAANISGFELAEMARAALRGAGIIHFMGDEMVEAAKRIQEAGEAARKAFESQTDIVANFASVAGQQEAAAERVTSAQEAVADASERAAERQASSAERVADAQQNYADTAQQIAEQVAEAQERAAERQVAAAERVLDAERRANDQRKTAAERVRDAEQRLRDLQERQSAAGDPKRAAEVARQQELRRAQRDLTEARKDQVEAERKAREDIADAREDQAKADREALEAAEMTTAQRRQLADAEKGIAKAEEQAAKDNAEAQKQVAAAVRDLADARRELAGLSMEAFFTGQSELAQNFIRDIQAAAERGLDPAIIERLLRAGPEQAAPFLQQILGDHSGRLIGMANDVQARLDEFSVQTAAVARVTRVAVEASSDDMIRNLGVAMVLARETMKTGGKRSVEALAAELNLGVDDVKAIAAQFGIDLATGLNPVLAGIGARQISPFASNAEVAASRGTAARTRFAGGGQLPDAAKYQPAGTLVQWAEPETGGEWFLPDAPTKRKRSLGIAAEMLDRWGYEIVRKESFATGGFRSPEDVPLPPDFGRWGDKVGYTGAESTRYLYEKVLEYVKANAGTGYGYQALIDYLQTQGVPFTVTSTTRPGSITANGTRSLHADGLAGDFVSSNMRRIFDSFLQVSSSLQELFYDPAGFSVKGGQEVGWTVGGHDDHVHAATWPGPPHPGLPGGRGGGYNLAGIGRGAAGAVGIGQEMAAERGWTGSQWDALHALWQRESGWDPYAVNPSSGAYGIPQIHPGAHGHPVPLGDAAGQIGWGLNYIGGRYTDPIRANQFQLANNWYGQGGFHVGVMDNGGSLLPGWNLNYNGTGRPEAVVPDGASHRLPTPASSWSAAPSLDYERLARSVAIDYDKLGRSVAQALVGVSVDVDGRRLGEITSQELRRRGVARGGMR